MNKIVVQPFHFSTTQFGFGCSSLLGLLSEKESRKLIDAAYDVGIRHFDVARSYGYGEVEGLLGRTLGPRRASVTITTKFGLPVPRSQALVRTARALARPFVKRLKGMRARSKAALSAIATTVEFNAQEAARSLSTSLAELQTSHVDLFLLHEVRAGLLTDPSLLNFLQDCIHTGKIRGFGVGSDVAVLPELIAAHPEYCPVVQHESSIYSAAVTIPPQSFRICHGALLRPFSQMKERIARDPKQASDAVGLDLSNDENVAALLLRSAVLRNPDAITLFSARSPKRIQSNVESLMNAKLDPYCARLASLAAN